MAASRRRQQSLGGRQRRLCRHSGARSFCPPLPIHCTHLPRCNYATHTHTQHTGGQERREEESHHTCPATFCRHVHRGESNPASFFAPCASPPKRRGHRSRARGLVNRMGGNPRRRVLRAPDDQKGSAFASRRVGLLCGGRF